MTNHKIVSLCVVLLHIDGGGSGIWSRDGTGCRCSLRFAILNFSISFQGQPQMPQMGGAPPPQMGMGAAGGLGGPMGPPQMGMGPPQMMGGPQMGGAMGGPMPGAPGGPPQMGGAFPPGPGGPGAYPVRFIIGYDCPCVL